jgi:tetratricopeptide (TPR) repeat protein
LSSGTDRHQPDPLTEAVDLDPDRRREILAREALLGRDDWTVLGLKPGATAEAVKLAYFDASRVFHPDRYYGKNLGSFRARLERIFQRLSEAHEKLTESLRHAAPPSTGGARAGPRSSPSGSSAAADPRAEERRARLARHPYLATKARAGALVEEAQRQMKAAPEKALHLLEQAKALGGHAGKARAPALEVEAKQQLSSKRADDEMKTGNAAAQEGDAAAAAHAYVRASELDPQRPDAAYEAARWLLKASNRPLAEVRGFAQRAVTLRADHLPSQLVLAEICIRMGMGSVARRHLEAALKLDPRNAEAKALLRQVR